jgi:RHS repeat-associated protein
MSASAPSTATAETSRPSSTTVSNKPSTTARPTKQPTPPSQTAKTSPPRPTSSPRKSASPRSSTPPILNKTTSRSTSKTTPFHSGSSSGRIATGGRDHERTGGDRFQRVCQGSAGQIGETGGNTTYYAYNNDNELECSQLVATPCDGHPTKELSHYSYDSGGEETAITPERETGGASFEYNAASELSSLTPSGASALALSYGGTGQDDLLNTGSATTIQNSLLGITREISSPGTSYYARTPNGLLIDERTPTGNYNPLYDAQGNVIALVTTTGKVERTFHYGPYGENIESEGTQTIPYPFGYKGGYRMPAGNTGQGNITNNLIHYGQRYYDPTTGRWTQQDPEDRIASAMQGDRFVYAGVDPVNLSDPSGKFCIPIPWAGLGFAECVTEAYELGEEVSENFPKCYGNEIEGGEQCSSAPPGGSGPDDPFYPLIPEI